MPKMIFRGQHVLKMSGLEKAHRLGLQARISASTVNRYINAPEKVQAFDMSILARLLLDGVGLTPKQVADLRLGDLFEIVPD